MEIFDKIISMVDGYPLSNEEAHKIRTAFVAEREEYRKQHTKSMEAYLGWDLESYPEE